jgi:hypothetical protein
VGLFGKAGAELIPLLNAGSGGIKELREEARRLGIVFDEKSAKAAEEFNDSLTRMGERAKGLIYSFGAPLLDPLNKSINVFGDLVDVNRDLIDQHVSEWVSGITGILPKNREEMQQLIDKIENLGSNFKAAWDFIGGFEGAALIMGASLAGPVVMNVYKLITALKALSLAIVSTPIGLILTVAAASVPLVMASADAVQGVNQDLEKITGDKSMYYDIGSGFTVYNPALGSHPEASPAVSPLPSLAPLPSLGPYNGFAPPAMPGINQNSSTTRTEIKEEKTTVRLILPPGMEAQTIGPPSENVQIQTGDLGVQNR